MTPKQNIVHFHFWFDFKWCSIPFHASSKTKATHSATNKDINNNKTDCINNRLIDLL